MEKNALKTLRGSSLDAVLSDRSLEDNKTNLTYGWQGQHWNYEAAVTDWRPRFLPLDKKCDCDRCRQIILQRGILNLKKCPSCNHFYFYKDESCECGHMNPL